MGWYRLVFYFMFFVNYYELLKDYFCLFYKYNFEYVMKIIIYIEIFFVEYLE